MSKCRVIIADTEAEYMFPLQQLFAERYMDAISLEIISDADYFRRLFSAPQEVGVLIVSEALYDASLHRHGIAHLFVLTERENPAIPGVIWLKKYTRDKELFAKVTGLSADVLTGEQKKETTVLLVSAACGGVGKTTVALGLAAALTENYKKVLYLNADYLQTFQYRLEDQSSLHQRSLYAELAQPQTDLYGCVKGVLRQEGFAYLPAFRGPVISLGLEFDVFEKLAAAAAASGEYDYIIIDSHMDFDRNKVRLMAMADQVLIVTRQARASVLATNMLCASIGGLNGEKYLFVCNDYDGNAPDYTAMAEARLRFSITERVAHTENCEKLSCGELGKIPGIQRLALLMA